MDMKTQIVLLSLGYICYCMNNDPEPVSQLDLDKFTGCWFMIYTPEKYTADYLKDVVCKTVQFKTNNNREVTQTFLWMENRTFFRPWLPPPRAFIDSFEMQIIDQPGTFICDHNITCWILNLGPVVNNQYDYQIMAAKSKNVMVVMSRNISRFNEMYDIEVKEWMREHTTLSMRREEHPDWCKELRSEMYSMGNTNEIFLC